MKVRLPLSLVIEPAALRSGPSTVAVTAAPQERAAIARDLGLLALHAVSAELTVTVAPHGEVAITGRLDAALEQSCVVSLRPVAQTIAAEVSRRFVPAGGSPEIGGAAEDPPDEYDGALIDVGAMVLEELILAVDPYPRAEGAELPAAPNRLHGPSESPFSVLKTLGHS
jgi:hypothetical protein